MVMVELERIIQAVVGVVGADDDDGGSGKGMY